MKQCVSILLKKFVANSQTWTNHFSSKIKIFCTFFRPTGTHKHIILSYETQNTIFTSTRKVIPPDARKEKMKQKVCRSE